MKRSFILFIIPFAFCAALSFVLSRHACKSMMQAEAVSRIPFMHKTHISKYGIQDCTVCHKYDDNGRFRGIPTIGECTACHKRDGSLTARDHMTPRKKTMFDSYRDNDKPWTSWAQQPDLVYFSHIAVMTVKKEDEKAKVTCMSCHGDKANSIDNKMIRGKMLMGRCMDCHTALKLSNKCAVCHD